MAPFVPRAIFAVVTDRHYYRVNRSGSSTSVMPVCVCVCVVCGRSGERLPRERAGAWELHGSASLAVAWSVSLSPPPPPAAAGFKEPHSHGEGVHRRKVLQRGGFLGKSSGPGIWNFASVLNWDSPEVINQRFFILFYHVFINSPSCRYVCSGRILYYLTSPLVRNLKL